MINGSFEFVGDASDEQAFGQAGGGKVAYLRSIRSEDVPNLFPDAPAIKPGMKLFALLAADGTPIVVTDSRDTAIANAWAHDLEAVNVH
ncbi:DUF1150 family protein [Pseudochelatococcus sp. G4_1912]|uniref:BQ00720 family protein n=1 Tax=Pseudochelatococcus sp. G4_1912 TaxID=3114288 RepID=UPI0039C5DC40